MFATASLLAALAVLPAPDETDDAAPERCCSVWLGARGALEIDPTAPEDPTLRDVAEQYAALTDQGLTFDREVASLLDSTPVGLQRSVRIPAEDVQSFFEQLLVSHDFVLQVLRTEAPRVLQIRSLRSHGADEVTQEAHLVPAEDVPHFRRHPATIVTTAVQLENADVRSLAASLRTLLGSPAIRHFSPGPRNTSVVTGYGSTVARVIELLHMLDDAAAGQPQVAYEVVRLRNAEARRVASMLHPLVSRGDSDSELPGPRVRVSVDERTNSVVLAARSADLGAVVRLVEELDVDG